MALSRPFGRYTLGWAVVVVPLFAAAPPTIRESILAHDGEAVDQRLAFVSLSAAEQDSIVEYLKSLQVLPPGTAFRVVDENFEKKDGLFAVKAHAEVSAGDVRTGPVGVEIQQ